MASRKIGALWRKEKDGKVFYTGVLQDLSGDINIAVFVNDRKEQDNHPDLNIVLSERKEEKQNSVGNDPFAPANGQNEAKSDEPEINVDDIPFN